VLQRVRTVALGAAVIVGLGGCSLLEPATTDDPMTAIETCALGKTWTLDTADMAAQVKAQQGGQGRATEVVIDGSQTFDWSLEGAVELTSDYSVVVSWVPAADQLNVVTETHSGTATGIAYISGEVAIPRDWDPTGLTVATTATLNDAPVDPPPFGVGLPDIDDAVGLEMTCDGTTMTTHPRGGVYTQKWTTG